MSQTNTSFLSPFSVHLPPEESPTFCQEAILRAWWAICRSKVNLAFSDPKPWGVTQTWAACWHGAGSISPKASHEGTERKATVCVTRWKPAGAPAPLPHQRIVLLQGPAGPLAALEPVLRRAAPGYTGAAVRRAPQYATPRATAGRGSPGNPAYPASVLVRSSAPGLKGNA